MQRIGGVLFALEALAEFTVRRLERCQLGAELVCLGAEAGQFVILGRDGREFTAERTRLEGVGNLGGGEREAIEAGFF